MKKRTNNNIRYKIIIGILILLLIISLGFVSSLFRKNVSLSNQISDQKVAIKKQKVDINALANTKDVRNFNSMKDETNTALSKALNALYTYKGKEYENRYNKALKYMDKNVVVGVTTNGEIPSKSEMKQAGIAMQKAGKVSKVIEINNGIQGIKGNTVSGFVWFVTKFGGFNKDNNVDAYQIKYSYDLNSHKFTAFKAEPFSGTVSN